VATTEEELQKLKHDYEALREKYDSLFNEKFRADRRISELEHESERFLRIIENLVEGKNKQ